MDDAAPGPAPAEATARRPVAGRVLRGLAIAIVALLALLVLAAVVLSTSPGRRFVADRINGYTLASGLNLQVGRIDGSIYGAMVLYDVRLRDQRGVFATSPELRLDWRPLAFARNHVDIRALTSPLIRIARLPELKAVPSDPDAPILPDIDIDVDRLAIDRIELAPPVAGRRATLRLAGAAHIADRRAQINAEAVAIAAPGLAGGDQLMLRLDAVPDADRLDLALDLRAPKGGVLAGITGADLPLQLMVGGRGSWARWDGRVRGAMGGQPLADLGVAARDGRFAVRGIARPGLVLEGPVERLTRPGLKVALDATLGDARRVDADLRLSSDALAMTARGLLDLGASRFGDVRVDALLRTPGAIADNLNGDTVRATLALAGPFATPTVDYRVTAAAIGFGTTVVERLQAEGRATVDADRILIPVSARAMRVRGLNAAAGGLLTNVRVDGDLAVNGATILSDNLRLRSDRIEATAILVADIAAGRYTGALKGRVNDYRIDSVGIVNVQTDADLYTAPGGGYGIRGRVALRTARIFNDGARSFLGGNAYASAQVGIAPDGRLTLARLRLNAPDFRITDGSGSVVADGPIRFAATGYSTQYGPVAAQVEGTVARPVVLLRAARPGVGVGLSDLVARVRGQGDGYAIVANGETDYGPVRADVLLRTAGALSVDVRAARFAGMDITGRLRQAPAGPFAGALDFGGSGVNGVARLSAAGATQRVDVNARASNAVIPGDAGLTIGRATITGSALLAETPTITGDAQFADVSTGNFVLARGRGRINLRGGSGTAQLFGEGSSGVPFRIAANARIAPDQYVVALEGAGNGIDFRTATPARIVRSEGVWRLAPTRIDLKGGSMTLAGRYGNGLAMQSRITSLDLSLVNAFLPGLGIAGAASGSVDFTQGQGARVPEADARLTIKGFRRSSLSSVSAPVDIVFAGNVDAGGGQGRALIRRGDTTIGRMVATLAPLPAGAGGWVQQLLAAPLDGGLRYNGPAGVLFSFAGIADQQLSGPVAVGVDFGGRLGAPQLNGVVRATNLTYDNETYGTRLTAMRLNGRFTRDRFDLTDLSARAGEGTVQATGTIGLAADRGFPIDIRAKLANARLARGDSLGATATGDIRIVNGPDGGGITGQLTIPEARYQIVYQGASEVPALTGVRRKREIARAADARARPRPTPPPTPGNFRLNLRINADNRVYVSGMGLESEWSINLRVRGTATDPRVVGRAEVIRGTYSFAGKRFDLTRGIVNFEGGPVSNPQLDIAASTRADDVTATLSISGSGQSPRVVFSSTPALAQDEVLSRLLFGRSVTDLSATEAIQLAAALNSLRGGGGGLNPLGSLRSAVGIDRLRILGADEASNRDIALAAGQYITDDIYVEIITDARGFTATQLEIALTRALSVLSQTSSFGGSNVNVRYSRDY
ncbi:MULTISPECIES: translocation/assembly module TamB domain-containing protein [unclassified Sphingomonas]|uniref:translocation/assembly module TamB domain-containing protein n=1 Tax=unclassified Sphingomonas TaxID=196159 RepID=UPI000831E8D2|nr:MULTISPECIES: translocation/assembly module TamB domain-containing protein [unclassified Sphingomonas]